AWEKRILEDMLSVLATTERIYEQDKSMKIAIELIEEMMNSNYKVVLTGKLNQDPAERLFGIIRSVDSHPTVTSFQQIIRYVSLGARLSTILKGSNVDNKEEINVLVTMSKCLQRHAKECDVNASYLKAVLEDKLLKEISIRYVTQIDEPANSDFVKDILIYDLCGLTYLLISVQITTLQYVTV
ncbi:Uncharacterized protein APZ42_000517, partial [Daphnia magna]